MSKRVWIDPDPFQFISELHDKIHDGYMPTQEDIEECARLINIIFDAMKPAMTVWVESLNNFIQAINENLEYMEPEMRERLEMYGRPITVPEAGVEPEPEPEPEEPMGHPHFSFTPGMQYVYIPPDYQPNFKTRVFYDFSQDAEANIADVSRHLDRGTES